MIPDMIHEKHGGLPSVRISFPLISHLLTMQVHSRLSVQDNG